MSNLHVLFAGFTLIVSTSAFAEEHQVIRDSLNIGEVSFPISCSSETNDAFNQALALMHSFQYPEARKSFRAITKAEPDCAMAYWGVAIGYFQQIWSKPLPEENRKALEMLEKANLRGKKTELETRYIEILSRFYEAFESETYAVRLQSYEDAMAQLSIDYPDHSETTVFHALSLLANAYSSPPDSGYSRQIKAGELLEEIYASAPDHPGVVHYIIHSYDYPELAERALDAARHYAKIAPDSPHALHMPSHIFTRLGYWQDSISSNVAAAESARRNHWTGEELHAIDYLVYAYMQTGQRQKAKKVIQKIPDILIRRRQNEGLGDTFSSQAAQARYAMELRDWEMAAAISKPDNDYNQTDQCRLNASIHFARGLGAAHLGDEALANEAIDALQSCLNILSSSGPLKSETGSLNNQLWKNLIEAQHAGIVAHLTAHRGDVEKALQIMRNAADIEDATDKPPTTPGAISPARELLGDMLFAFGRPRQALVEYEASLEHSNDRLRSLHGAAKSAAAVKDSAKATRYYQRLLNITRSGDKNIVERTEAKTYLKAQE